MCGHPSEGSRGGHWAQVTDTSGTPLSSCGHGSHPTLAAPVPLVGGLARCVSAKGIQRPSACIFLHVWPEVVLFSNL